jgi:predicted small metal-binding protein
MRINEMTPTTRLRWECLEPGCGFATESADEDRLVEDVHEHMSSAHNTFELEDVILANAQRASDGDG